MEIDPKLLITVREKINVYLWAPSKVSKTNLILWTFLNNNSVALQLVSGLMLRGRRKRKKITTLRRFKGRNKKKKNFLRYSENEKNFIRWWICNTIWKFNIFAWGIIIRQKRLKRYRVLCERTMCFERFHESRVFV